MAPGSSLHLDVILKVPDPAALTAFIADLSNRRSPLFDHFLRRGQFGALFGPGLAVVAAVRTALQQEGLSPGPVTSDRLAIPVTVPAATAERAFATNLVRYRLAGGRVAYANTSAPEIPAAVAPYVSGVLGLNELYQAHSMLVRPAPRSVGQRQAAASRAAAAPHAAGPRPCAAASAISAADGSFTPDELAAHYGLSPLYSLGDLGAGVRVALFELEPNSTSDIAAYEACYGLDTPVTYTTVDGGAGTGAGSGEAALDIEDVMGLAPDVAIDVYQGPNSEQGVYDTYNAIVSADEDQVISTGWGECELYSAPALLEDEQVLFEEAAAQGQSVFAAAGDSGSTDCLGEGGPYAADLSVDDPSSQPYVTGVGGTSIGPTSEGVWNDSATSDGAGGGGLSAAWCMPSYQYQPAIPGLINADSEANGACPTAQGQYVRQAPDVSADANPATGYVWYWNGAWGPVGGTSAAAPLWAAVAALIDDSPFCQDYGSGDAGVRPEGLYDVASAYRSYIYSSSPQALRDVTSGNNDYTPSGYTGGLFPATAGYNMAGGLGTPLVSGFGAGGEASTYYPGLAALMCHAYATKLTSAKVTGVSPRQGPLGGSQKITVTGSGFLPIAGADMALVGSTWVTATCPSSTTCTVVTPKHSAGTVNIQISAEDLSTSRAIDADHYQYVAAPGITSLSPRSGAKRGGYKVTIRGSNFIGVQSVHFGRKLATHLKVLSSTEITVTAPAGSGTVSVKVTAAGGTSTARPFKY
jgi:subtilase family serine protease